MTDKTSKSIREYLFDTFEEFAGPYAQENGFENTFTLDDVLKFPKLDDSDDRKIQLDILTNGFLFHLDKALQRSGQELKELMSTKSRLLAAANTREAFISLDKSRYTYDLAQTSKSATISDADPHSKESRTIAYQDSEISRLRKAYQLIYVENIKLTSEIDALRDIKEDKGHIESAISDVASAHAHITSHHEALIREHKYEFCAELRDCQSNLSFVQDKLRFRLNHRKPS